MEQFIEPLNKILKNIFFKLHVKVSYLTLYGSYRL